MDSFTVKSQTLSLLKMTISILIEMGVQPYEVYNYVGEYLQTYVLRKQDIVSPPEVPSPYVRRHGYLVFDLINRLITYKGCSAKLSKKEAALFVLFMDNPGSLISSNRLIQAIQIDTYKTQPTVLLRINVNYLRKKLANIPGGNNWIITEHGKGYYSNLPND